MFTDYGYFETADVQVSLPPFDMFNGEAGLDVYYSHNRDKISLESAKSVHKVLLNAPDWIPFAAEVYETSKDVKDYFLVPTIIMPSDLPNRNGVAFPFTELTKFSPEIGDLSYRGWKGKPVHVEHENANPVKAIGMVADVSMRKMNRANLHKVITLLAIDRTKRTNVTNEILAGRRNNYSMGAMVKGHVCSVCGSKSFIQSNHRTKFDGLRCKEAHASMSRNHDFRIYDNDDGTKKLGYLNVHGIMPIEVSSVGVPAYVSAETNFKDLMSF